MKVGLDAEKASEFIDAESWRLLPHTFAEKVSKGDWQAYNYLRYISIVIARGIFEGNGRFIIEAPPRHGKSELISHWLPCWFLNLYPNKRVILTTYAAEFAQHWGRVVRNEIKYNELIDVGISDDSSAAHRWATPEGGGMITAGVGGQILGRGGDLLLIDDPTKNWEEATSITYRERVKQWFRTTFYTRKEPNASIILLMQRWHQDDLAGYLQNEHGDKWNVISFKAMAESVDDILGRSEGEPLCSERFDREALKAIKQGVGPLTWSFLYQQRPTPLEGGIIKRKDIRYYDRLPSGNGTWAQSWDMAFKKTDKSSFVVGQVWFKHGANHYLVDQVRARMDFNDTLEAVKNLSNKWPMCRLKLVEEKANGAAVINALQSKIPGLTPVTPRGSKVARLSAVSPYFASGNVLVPNKILNPWVVDWEEEVINIPNAPNDDQADAASQMLDYWADNKISIVSPAGSTRVSPLPR